MIISNAAISCIGDSKSPSRNSRNEILSISTKAPNVYFVQVLWLYSFFSSVGKKKCWIRDGRNAYVEAEVKGSENDGKIIVETSDGKVKGSFFHRRDN